jgi:hypothetical protein
MMFLCIACRSLYRILVLSLFCTNALRIYKHGEWLHQHRLPTKLRIYIDDLVERAIDMWIVGLSIFRLSYMVCRMAVLCQLPLRVRANSFCHCSVACECVRGCACLGGRLRRYRAPPSVCVGVRVVRWAWGHSRWVKPHHPLKVGAYMQSVWRFTPHPFHYKHVKPCHFQMF